MMATKSPFLNTIFCAFDDDDEEEEEDSVESEGDVDIFVRLLLLLFFIFRLLFPHYASYHACYIQLQ